MQESSVTFYFEGATPVELVRTQVELVGAPRPHTCVRGKTSGAYAQCGCFQWTSGVRGVCAAFLRFVLSERDTSVDYFVSGGKASLAASLDYALSKGPTWLLDMFGSGRNGTLFARRFFRISNPNRKRPGPVVISVNGSAINSCNIRFFWEGRPVQENGRIKALLDAIEAQEPSNSDTTGSFPLAVSDT